MTREEFVLKWTTQLATFGVVDAEEMDRDLALVQEEAVENYKDDVAEYE